MKPSALRIAVIVVYAGLAGVLGGYLGGRVASTEILRVAFNPPTFMAPAPREWADI